MGFSEISYRAVNSIQNILESNGIGLATAIPSIQSSSQKALEVTLPKSLKVSGYKNAADKILNGKYNVFALENTPLGFPPNWNQDPKTKTQAPMVFGKTLNYRDEETVGDIKYLWEPNRHNELVTLAQAFYLTDDILYANACRELLDSWFEQCPYPLGVNWISSLEHSIRVLNWSYTWKFLGGDNSPLFKDIEGQKFRTRWLNSIYQHCHFISHHFSRYSSANNHLLGEYMGLYIASSTWPLWEKSIIWNAQAKKGFENESLSQNYADGVNKEQGIWYHHEVADMMLLCGLVAQNKGDDFCPEYWIRLESMLEFIASIMDFGSNIPMIGDSDDAVMVRFSQEGGFNVYKSLLATGAILFDRPEFKAKAGKLDDKTRWLIGGDVEEKFSAINCSNVNLPIHKSFSDAGYYILGCDFETTKEIRIIVDAGPLGYLSIAAHGHADALALTLSVAGNEILIDPGTYAYHTQKKWRDYFRGTSAHNTITVDKIDQSISGGNFLWIKHANAKCTEFSHSKEVDSWSGEHDGYLRLKDEVIHKRDLTFDKVDTFLTVVDSLVCDGIHDIDLHWHFAESCMIDVIGRRVDIRVGNVVISMEMCASDWQPELIKGQENPPLGWVSKRFDEKEAVTTVRWSGTIQSSTDLTTTFKIEIT